ncbi:MULTISPECIES: hypothetical protein [Paenibacillus]|uniref:hypothetical protein n=1 Tax=Paenibacillus TaxID=44249 RepID=UPI000D31A4FC|nr:MULTISPECIES: hypothetical protein [Paenibacillus]KAF6614267.1 hypothetical protein HFE00_25710 [Paenibacillus sp. EKM101P]KAF6616608.1 hypothetical protein HFE03_25650 [Paenibacillus sp. EKM102P]KAF6625087.1 hypothetical protein HFE01_25955 [Paenibacillus sp. EKM10P]KAF6640915.1 hypothetical protein HFE02_25715 [Paenibacillus sp. EKM11P]PTU44222.1 hypothetical protein DBL67_24435 [Paenibacillus polymyxa]
MTLLTTGPIENSPVSGVRTIQQVTVKMVNRDLVNSSTILIQGYVLDGLRTLFVLEVIALAPNAVATRNYTVNFNAYEFVFTTSGLAEESTDISVWGKNESGAIIGAQRIVADEQLES